MANLTSTTLTNMDATPPVAANAFTHGAMIREAVETIEVSTSEAAGAIVRMVRLPSNARISELLLSIDALTSGATDIGLYRTAGDGGAVVDADAFASAQALGSALTRTSVMHESGVFGIEDVKQRLWELAGLSADPNVEYDIALTITTVPGAGGTVSLAVQWTI